MQRHGDGTESLAISPIARVIMTYGLVFLAFGALMAWKASSSDLHWTLWPAASCTAIGVGYLANFQFVFGKRADGSLHPLGVALHLPYLLFLWTTWRLVHWIRVGPPFVELLPDVVIGRRLLPGEEPAGIEEIVDLTSEFAEPVAIRRAHAYISFPILDAAAPEPAALVGFVRSLDIAPRSRYVHCAEGHGRTGLVASALLLWRNLATSPDEALAAVQRVRPSVRLNTVQRRCLSDFHRLTTNLSDDTPRTNHHAR